jgi:hypothetical protein
MIIYLCFIVFNLLPLFSQNTEDKEIVKKLLQHFGNAHIAKEYKITIFANNCFFFIGFECLSRTGLGLCKSS